MKKSLLHVLPLSRSSLSSWRRDLSVPFNFPIAAVCSYPISAFISDGRTSPSRERPAPNPSAPLLWHACLPVALSICSGSERPKEDGESCSAAGLQGFMSDILQDLQAATQTC